MSRLVARPLTYNCNIPTIEVLSYTVSTIDPPLATHCEPRLACIAYLLNAPVYLYISCQQKGDTPSTLSDSPGCLPAIPFFIRYFRRLNDIPGQFFLRLSHDTSTITWTSSFGLRIFRRLVLAWTSAGNQMSTTNSLATRTTPWMLQARACMACQNT